MRHAGEQPLPVPSVSRRESLILRKFVRNIRNKGYVELAVEPLVTWRDDPQERTPLLLGALGPRQSSSRFSSTWSGHSFP